MTDFIQFIEKMGKETIQLTYIVMVNILKYVPFIPDELKTQKMCVKSIEDHPLLLMHVPDRFKVEGLCIKAVRR